MNGLRKVGKLLTNNSCLLICDIQEKFRNSIFCFPEIVQVSKRLLLASKILNLPIIVTEQYPEGLGYTVKELELSKHNLEPIKKKQFSMCVPETLSKLKDNNIKNVILCGIETHVCVQNTAIDLLLNDFDVHIIVDACSSRSKVDRMFAFDRIKSAGGWLTTSESAILGLIGDSSHLKFKELQKLILEKAPDSKLI